MSERRRLSKRLIAAGAVLLAVLAAAAWYWRDDILRTSLDPRVPFQTYRPPPAPDYGRREAWARLPEAPERPSADDPPLDVFFVHPTTYDGGSEWNGPVDDARARRRLAEVMLPNHAGPYQAVGRVFAPRYRQASLYTRLTLRDDAREARAFAYADVRRAFRLYLERYNSGRPFLLAGVEQGGEIAARLLRDEVARDPALLDRMAGAHLVETVAPEGGLGAPACVRRDEPRCVLAFASIGEGNERGARRRLERALVWSPGGELVNLGNRPAVCVNPLTGSRGGAATAAANRGAANASGLEWGLRPGFMPRQVAARCAGGLLRVSRPESGSLRPGWGWAERRRAPGFNLFYADLEADAKARLQALEKAGYERPAPPIGRSVEVRGSPIHRID